MSANLEAAASVEPARRRLFFALWPGVTVRELLASAFHDVAAAAGGQSVVAANLHVTLEFLGSIAEERVAELEALGASMRLPVGDLVLDTIEWWPRPALLVAGALTPSAALVDLQSELRRLLGIRGFRVDSRAFRPHLTLARRVRGVPPIEHGASVRWPMRELALVESLPVASGSRYSPLARWSR